MSIVGIILGVALGAAPAHSNVHRVQMFHVDPVPLQGVDSPGLLCKALRSPAPVYIDPDTRSERIMMVGVAIAVTGREREGFIPVRIASGQKGWVESWLVSPVNGIVHLGFCHAHLLSSGRVELIYTAR